MKITVLGAGAWGTALASHLAVHHDTILWTRNSALVTELCVTRKNSYYLPDVVLPSTLRYDTNLSLALEHTSVDESLVVLAVPVAGLRGILRAMSDIDRVPVHFVWLCKGFEVDTQLMPHQVVAGELPHHTCNGVLSGPSFAREVAAGLPVALTVASTSAICQARAISAFHHRAMRIYTGDDVIGVEVGGAVKNVLAIATGISDGFRLGLNARAALITRGLTEMSRLGVTLGGRAETFSGLTGLGDLILTATGDLSRNRTVGIQLASGRSLDDILATLGYVAEGVRCVAAVSSLAQAHNIDMPITQTVYAVLFKNVSPRDAVSALLKRDAKAE